MASDVKQQSDLQQANGPVHWLSIASYILVLVVVARLNAADHVNKSGVQTLFGRQQLLLIGCSRFRGLEWRSVARTQQAMELFLNVVGDSQGYELLRLVVEAAAGPTAAHARLVCSRARFSERPIKRVRNCRVKLGRKEVLDHDDLDAIGMGLRWFEQRVPRGSQRFNDLFAATAGHAELWLCIVGSRLLGTQPIDYPARVAARACTRRREIEARDRNLPGRGRRRAARAACSY
eukprot:SAG31_NODE_4352_length_3321_cov_6.948790_2_plen_234_part_00